MGRAFGCEGTDGNGDRVALGVRRGIACGGGVVRTAYGSTESRPTDVS